MFEFFRKYQRYFFIFITTVIAISFSFFGTYQTLQGPQLENVVAFRAVDGTDVSRRELDEALMFFSSDAEDTLLSGGAWGGNALNDGIVRKEIFETGIVELLIAEYPELFREELQQRLEKEKRYALYAHPDAGFVSTVTTWSYFAPAMKHHFDVLQKSSDPTASDAVAARVQLYLGEKQFPAPLLRRALQYQQAQYGWLTPDPNLNRLDLSLFGYHTAEDWFGPKLMRLAVEYILNGAKIAEQRGYRVSKAEALADLIHNSDVSFQQQAQMQHPGLNVATSQEYFDEQLRRMRLDQNKASKIWQSAMLYRRLFHDAGHSLFVDRATFSTFLNYSKAAASGTFYELPRALRLGNYKDLQKFEIYLEAVAGKQDSLLLPEKFYSAEEIVKTYPELVQKRYLLKITPVDKESLIPQVSVKEMWRWEADGANWAVLKEEFPELALKPGKTRSERSASLDTLNTKVRARVDSYARKAIVEAHPEWIDAALENSSAETIEVGINLKGVGSPFVGAIDGKKLITLLDQAPIRKDLDLSAEEEKAARELSRFSADGQHFYKIEVIERSPELEVMTFAESNQKKILDGLVAAALEGYYEKERGNFPEEFQNEDLSWKPFIEVKELVSNLYFAKQLQAVQAAQEGQADLSGNAAAPLRLRPHLAMVKEKIQRDPASESLYIAEEKLSDVSLQPAADLKEQWKLKKHMFTAERRSKHEKIDAAEMLGLPVDGWSKLYSFPNGEFFFYRKDGNQDPEIVAAVWEKVAAARGLFSSKIQLELAADLIALYKEKEALSIADFDSAPEWTADE